jgi:hypothetical protein
VRDDGFGFTMTVWNGANARIEYEFDDPAYRCVSCGSMWSASRHGRCFTCTKKVATYRNPFVKDS